MQLLNGLNEKQHMSPRARRPANWKIRRVRTYRSIRWSSTTIDSDWIDSIDRCTQSTCRSTV